MSPYSPFTMCSGRADSLPARPLGRAGRIIRSEENSARPVLFASTDAAHPGHFQSDDGFATIERLLAKAQAANRRSDGLLTRIQLGIAAVAVLWIVVPAACMALAGGVPA